MSEGQYPQSDEDIKPEDIDASTLPLAADGDKKDKKKKEKKEKPKKEKKEKPPKEPKPPKEKKEKPPKQPKEPKPQPVKSQAKPGVRPSKMVLCRVQLLDGSDCEVEIDVSREYSCAHNVIYPIKNAENCVRFLKSHQKYFC